MVDDARCELIGVCSGCSWLGVAYSDQLARKREAIVTALRAKKVFDERLSVELVSAGQSRLRDRVDLTWRREPAGLKLGLFHVDRSSIVDLERCPQLSLELEAWLDEFRRDPPPHVMKGSVRLRVSPRGDRGAWLDLANTDVAELLASRSWLERMAARGTLEIGQRFKPLESDGSRLKLGREPRPAPWFETYTGPDLEPHPLHAVIGSFTQTGFRANKALVSTMLSMLGDVPAGRALELFSGLGNFTLPLAALGHEVTAYEVDGVATRCFERTLASHPKLAGRIRCTERNLYTAAAPAESFGDYDTLVVDPPRSGLREVLTALQAAPAQRLPRRIVYISCHAETLVSDIAGLAAKGYRLTRLTGVDQFAQSPHCEWVALLEIGH